jgi:hypothetical protein
LTDSDQALLKYVARVLGDLRRRYRLDGLHWPPELESLRLLVASEGQARPTLDFDANPGDSLAMTYEEAARKLAVSSRTVTRARTRAISVPCPATPPQTEHVDLFPLRESSLVL